jgi:hypothetical protein
MTIDEKLDRLERGLAVIGDRIDRLAAMFDEVRGITERAQQRDMELQACLEVELAREEAIEKRMAEVGTAVKGLKCPAKGFTGEEAARWAGPQMNRSV